MKTERLYFQCDLCGHSERDLRKHLGHMMIEHYCALTPHWRDIVDEGLRRRGDEL